jgi:hypothetical protein
MTSWNRWWHPSARPSLRSPIICGAIFAMRRGEAMANPLMTLDRLSLTAD